VRILVDRNASKAAELKRLIEAERAGLTVVVVMDRDDRQRVVVLEGGDGRLTIGRAAECDIVLDWDSRVSRVHAELTPLPGGWAVDDDGLSRNGTFVNGERLTGRHRLCSGDTIRCGATGLVYRAPVAVTTSTDAAESMVGRLEVTPMQRKVLIALCRPYREGADFAMPASNAAIAEELVLSVDAIKTHLRAVYEKFGLEEMPQNQKRVRLAQMALTLAIVTEQDLRGPRGQTTFPSGAERR
jgi:pSer/pThr/pTyr-binding forkhead associated (FHA) protein